MSELARLFSRLCTRNTASAKKHGKLNQTHPRLHDYHISSQSFTYTTLVFSCSFVIRFAVFKIMSLVAGPGRGGQSVTSLPGDLNLGVDQHVKYIQQLDTVGIVR